SAIIIRRVTTLVTGAFGCIGAWVIRGLLAADESPVAFDFADDPWRLEMIAGPDVGDRVTFVRGDIAERDALAKVVGDHGVDLIFVEDVAGALLAAAGAAFDGARVYNLHGEAVAIADVVRLIHEAWPAAKGRISHNEVPTPFAEALDDARYQRDFGPRTRTSLRDGFRRTLDEFARLQKEGRLDTRELDV